MSSARSFTDQMGREVIVPYPPKRIISLVPSLTELLFYLGLDEELVGVTRFCTYPKEKVSSKIRVGGTKKFNFQTINSLKPDLIIGNKEENYKEGIELLSNTYPVWMSNVNNFSQAYEAIEGIGVITARSLEAISLVEKIRHSISNIESDRRGSVAYFIWREPYMVVGRDTFINEILKTSGFVNVFESHERYPVVSLNELKEREPQFVFLSSEPYPFASKHVDELAGTLPMSKIILVDGKVFSWYGSSLLNLANYIHELKISIFKESV